MGAKVVGRTGGKSHSPDRGADAGPAPQPDTKERILDAAERMFAVGGFHGTSLRVITGEADVNLAAIHYHFGSKDDLIQAIFARRLAPLNAERLGLLDELEARAGTRRPDPEEIIQAFLTPVQRLAEDENTRRVVVSLVGQAIAQPDEKIRRLFIGQFNEVAQRFLAALTRAVPQLPPEAMFCRFMFMVGALVHSMTLSGHLEEFSGGACRADDASSLIAQLVPFVQAGMCAPAPAGGAGRASR